jgi:N,N'-diacetyllegionaminate synthase
MRKVLTVRNKRLIGHEHPPYIIAEIGTNHNRSFDLAAEMVREVARSGCDAAKFQIYEPNEIVSEGVRASDYGLDKLYGDISAKKMFEEYLKTPKEWFPRLRDLCYELGLDFTATIHGPHGLAWAKEIGLDVVKIASMDHTNIPFLKSLVNEVDAPILVSLGMATLKDIDAVVEALTPHKPGFGLFHCCAVYPPTAEELRLNNIPFLVNRYDVLVGFSDHTIENEAAIAARKKGAVFFEKHVTTDRKQSGPDHGFASNFSEFPSYVKEIKATPLEFGTANKFEEPGERELGNKRNYVKSVIAKNTIPEGKVISTEDVYLARPGTGIAPADLHKVIGRKAKHNIKSEIPLQWEDLA